MPRSRPPTAHLVPRSSGFSASSHDTKNASASRWTISRQSRGRDDGGQSGWHRRHRMARNRAGFQRRLGQVGLNPAGHEPNTRRRGHPEDSPYKPTTLKSFSFAKRRWPLTSLAGVLRATRSASSRGVDTGRRHDQLLAVDHGHTDIDQGSSPFHDPAGRRPARCPSCRTTPTRRAPATLLHGAVSVDEELLHGTSRPCTGTRAHRRRHWRAVDGPPVPASRQRRPWVDGRSPGPERMAPMVVRADAHLHLRAPMSALVAAITWLRSTVHVTIRG